MEPQTGPGGDGRLETGVVLTRVIAIRRWSAIICCAGCDCGAAGRGTHVALAYLLDAMVL